MQQPRPANGGVLSSQRIKSRKQSVPQRSCLDPAINNDLATRHTPSALLAAAAQRDGETTIQIKPVAPSRIPSSALRRSLALAAVRPIISLFSAPAQALIPTTAAAGPGGAAGAGSRYAHLAAHKAFTIGISKPAPSQQAPSKGRGRVKQQQPKVGMCSFCGETDSPMWRKGPEKYPHLCNRCGMRFCRYTKQERDPFTDSILQEIVQKREIRALPILASSASMTTTEGGDDATVPSQGGQPAVAKEKKGGKGKRSREAGAVAAVEACAAQQVGSDAHNEDGNISEQRNAKKPRGLNHLPAAAATAPLAHPYLLQILQGQNFDAELV